MLHPREAPGLRGAGADPFSSMKFAEWHTNELLLSDPKLRKLAGVSTLDDSITRSNSLSAAQKPTAKQVASK